MSLGLRKTPRKQSRNSVAHKITFCRFGSPSTAARQVSTATKALEALITAREFIGLVVDSNGTIKAIAASDGGPLSPLSNVLTEQSLDAVFGRNTHKLLSGVVEHARRAEKAQDCRDRNSYPRLCAVLIRSFPGMGESKQLFSMFGCGIVSDLQGNPEKAGDPSARLDEQPLIATWRADLRTGELAVSTELLSLLGLPPSSSQSVSEVLWEIVRCCRLTPHQSGQSNDRADFDANLGRAAQIFRGEITPVPCGTEPPLRFVARLVDSTELKTVERNLRDSQCLLSQAEQIANLGSWDFDVKTHKVKWSEQLYELFGFCPWQPAAEEIYWDNLHAADRIRVREITDRAIRDSKEFSYVARYRLPTGQYRVHYTRGIPVRGADGKTVRVIGIVQDITERARVEADLHRLSSELMRARDEERRHMARELHESAGQSLAALKMSLGNLREALPKKNCLANSLLQTCVDLTNEAVREVRTISYLMHPPMLDEAGLPSAVRWYAKGFADRSKIQVDVDVLDDFGRQSQEIEMTVFRIIQEALTNVHRYSGSKTAQIRLERNTTEIRAEISDQGCGLTHPMNGNGQASGVGIAGMRERIHQLNGFFEIQSIPGRGTTVSVLLPINVDVPAAAAQKLVDQLENAEHHRLQNSTTTRGEP